MTQTCQELLKAYRQKERKPHGGKLTFTGVGEKDVYNITAPFLAEGERLIAGRVEKRDTEFSTVRFFWEVAPDHWRPVPGTPEFELQDPFVAYVQGELVFGGVEVFPHQDDPTKLAWRTNFYRGRGVRDLQYFFSGPVGMKDIRLTELKDGRVGIFTRPQGEIGGRGKIGFTTVDSLTELSVPVLEQAPLLDLFIDDEWGGANEVHLLSNGQLGVLGHIARFDAQGNRHYYPMFFVFDPQTNQPLPMEIIAERADFPAGEAKRADLEDVIFSGGLVRDGLGNARLYAGVSDAEAHYLDITDPFYFHENK